MARSSKEGGRLDRAPKAFEAALLIGLLGAGCDRYWMCGDAGSAKATELPTRLSETGLYADVAARELAPGVLPFTPRFPLWSDGADKQRWIRLPEGASIDTRDMDDWIFPPGTKLWKEFSVGGVRIETRLLEKRGATEEDWASVSYVWDATGTEALAQPLGVVDAHATEHDVPAAGECRACHGGRRSFVLGFSAVQLAAPAREGEVDLDALVRNGRLTSPPTARPVVPGTEVEVAALGYLHANCGHCHNDRRPARLGPRCFDPERSLDFTLSVNDLGSAAATGTYRTAVGSEVKRGNPGSSRLFGLLTARGMFRQMPPLATEKVDTLAVATIRRWIEGL